MISGKRGRGAGGKTIVFGIFKRDGRVYTEIVPEVSKKTCWPSSALKSGPRGVIHSDGWRGYDGLVDVGYEKHLRIQHGRNQFARGNRPINGIESFRGYAKQRLARFNGIADATFYLHLKEMRVSVQPSTEQPVPNAVENAQAGTALIPFRPFVCFLSPCTIV